MRAKTTYRTIPQLFKYRVRFHRTKNEFGTWDSKFMGVEPITKKNTDPHDMIIAGKI